MKGHAQVRQPLQPEDDALAIASGCHSIAHMWIAAPRSCDVRSICDVRTSVR